MPQNTETFTVSTIIYTLLFQPKVSSLFQSRSEHFSRLVTHDFWYTTFVTCFWERFLFFQPISLLSSCSWPASSNVDWLCPQTTVNRAMVGSESILQDSGSIHTEYWTFSYAKKSRYDTCILPTHMVYEYISQEYLWYHKPHLILF